MTVQPDSLGFILPVPWDYDGCVHREPVLDADFHIPPRIVRYVGWSRCITCKRAFWSEDVMKLRMCGGCKAPDRTQEKPPHR